LPLVFLHQIYALHYNAILFRQHPDYLANFAFIFGIAAHHPNAITFTYLHLH
jgi:hypothetical protein